MITQGQGKKKFEDEMRNVKGEGEKKKRERKMSGRSKEEVEKDDES